MNELTGKKIVMVIPSFRLGGAERQALQLASYLKASGGRVELWAPETSGVVTGRVESLGIACRQANFPLPREKARKISRLWGFTRKLRQAKIEILLSFGYHANLTCGLTWRHAGVPVYFWNQRDEGLHFIGSRLERLAIRQTQHFISNSAHGAEFLENHFGVPAEKISIIPNGVELAEPQLSRQAWRDKLGIKPGTFVACMLANLSAYKDHETLLNAWRIASDHLQTQNQEAVLLLAGADAGKETKLKALAYDLDLGQKVRFLGYVEDIPGILAASDLAIFSTKAEGLPNGALESMAAGLAVVGTDLPGLREALPPQSWAYLSPLGDAAALAKNILALLTDEEKRETSGKINQQWCMQHFSFQQIGLLYLSTLINQGRLQS